ncbi:MAG TPA: hypothetical protein VNF29_05720 [Candidatus Binataceae bacterium]|nr:hypothetical protein [Candidatus Binataceae bacterium]
MLEPALRHRLAQQLHLRATADHQERKRWVAAQYFGGAEEHLVLMRPAEIPRITDNEPARESQTRAERTRRRRLWHDGRRIRPVVDDAESIGRNLLCRKVFLHAVADHDVHAGRAPGGVAPPAQEPNEPSWQRV